MSKHSFSKFWTTSCKSYQPAGKAVVVKEYRFIKEDYHNIRYRRLWRWNYTCLLVMAACYNDHKYFACFVWRSRPMTSTTWHPSTPVCKKRFGWRGFSLRLFTWPDTDSWALFCTLCWSCRASIIPLSLRRTFYVARRVHPSWVGGGQAQNHCLECFRTESFSCKPVAVCLTKCTLLSTRNTESG